MTRLLAVSLRTGGRRRLAATIAALGMLAVVPAAAHAFTVNVDWPTPVTVGQSGLTAHVTLTNTADIAATVCNAGECGGSSGIVVVPSCGAASPAGTCTTPDLGVFTVSSSAVVTLGSCGPTVTGFGVVTADPAQGSLRLVPVGGSVVLGPTGTATATCDIPLTFSVARLPTTDTSQTAGAQTMQSAAAEARVGVTGANPRLEPGAGRDETTVLPAPVVPPPVVPPPVVPPPVVPPPPVPPVRPAPVAPDGLDHFKCYEALQANFRQRTVGTRDQFGQRRTRVLRTRQLCNPVSKNGGKILRPRAHLTCYETRDQNRRFATRTVVVTNQFGQRKLRVLRPNRLCVPSLKRKTAGPLPSTPNPTRVLDHFRCYDVEPQVVARTVKTTDQFRSAETRVIQVIRLCNPVRKNNEPVRRAKAHLVCYTIRDTRAFNPIAVRVRNQFGRAALRVRQPQTLCLPSFKQVVSTLAPAVAPPGLDHFKCYDAEQPPLPTRFVGLRDQFGQSEGQVVATRQLCNPVRKNGGRIVNGRAHLVCYETPSVGTVPFTPREVRVSNQFGIRQLSVIRPVTLCVPSLKRKGAGAAPTGPNPTLVLDHFRCYDVKPQAAARTVTLIDQFKPTTTKVVRVVRLCNPTRKNNEPVRKAQAHLVCYSITEATFQPLAVTVRNQFGVAVMRVRRPSMLCLPSFKKLVTAAGTEIVTPNPA